MTRDIYRRMLIEDVIPAIKLKWEWVKDEEYGVPLKVPIRLQQDNAKPQAFQRTTYTTLNKTFLSMQLIMASIMKHDDGNSFPLGHFHKDKLLRADELPVMIPFDAALYWSALSKVTPQVTSLPPPELDIFLF